MISTELRDVKLAGDLDALYLEYLAAIRSILLKLKTSHDVVLCEKWIETLNSFPEGQKHARNYIISMIHAQLENNGALGRPFTDVSDMQATISQLLQLVLEDETLSRNTMNTTINSTDFKTVNKHSSRHTMPSSDQFTRDLSAVSKTYGEQIDSLSDFMLDLKKQNDSLRTQLNMAYKEIFLLRQRLYRRDRKIERLQFARQMSPTLTIGSETERQYAPQNSEREHFYATQANSLSKEVEEELVSVPLQNIFLALDQLIAELKLISLSDDPLKNLTNMKFDCFEHILNGIGDPEMSKLAYRYEYEIEGVLSQIGLKIRNSKIKEAVNIESKETQTDIPDDNPTISKRQLKKLIRRLIQAQEKFAQAYQRKLDRAVGSNQRLREVMRLRLASLKGKLLVEMFCKHEVDVAEVTTELEAVCQKIVTEIFDKLK